jgi:phage-related protein
MSKVPKPLHFCGDAHDILATFPEEARRGVGFSLYRVQIGREPGDWKPMPTVGVGVREIRVRDEAGAFRVLYVAKFVEAVYVLHCFQKTTRATSLLDRNIAAARYRSVILARKVRP